MALISLSKVASHYGGPLLFKGVTLEVERGQKIGVIGHNGCGKSTLLRILAGQLQPTDGQVFLQRGTGIAFQEQELSYDAGSTVLDAMREVYAEDFAREAKLRELEAQLADTDADSHDRALAEYERLQHAHESAGGYLAQQRIESVLSGLGLPSSAWQQPIDTFSGGERNIVGLAKIMLQRPDVMLLDEPSNHLDMDGIEWFIHFVRRSEAAMVMVSHNRHLLDATVDEIWEFSRGGIERYAGNYSDYSQQKAEKLALQERQYKSQQRMVKRLQFQARRLMDMANAYDDPAQAKRAKNMLRRIEQMDLVEKPNAGDKRFHASLSGGKRHGHIALSIEHLNFSYRNGDQTREIFNDASLELKFGDRVALVGPNGSGKTTLFKLLLEEAAWDNPHLRIGKSAQVGQYSQLHDDVLHQEQSLIDWVQGQTSLLFDAAAALLHRFLFARNDLDRPISSLSGGEKSRLQLVKLVHEKVNFLLLDEPTNHLDIQACEQLEDMLLEFEGTLLIISHDRVFLERLVNRVVELRDRALQPFEGSFSEWWEHAQARRKETSRVALQLHSQRDAADHQRSQAARYREDRKQQQRELHRLRKELRTLEDKISSLETKQEKLEAKLALAFENADDFEETRQLNDAFAELRQEISLAYQRWEEVAEQIEAAS